jgi:prevent-host-death family protein
MISMSVAEFKSRLSDVLAGLLEHRERVVVRRRGKPVAVLVSIEDARRLGDLPVGEPKGILAAVGAWADYPDPDAFLDDVYRAREVAGDRDVEPLA